MKLVPTCASACLALAVLAPALGCTRDEAPAETTRTAPMEARFPDAIGRFRALGAARPGVAELSGRQLVSAERTYEDEGREATLRIIDVSSERSLVSTFAIARRLEIDELDVLTRPIHIARQPALVQWTRDTGESELQVLARERYLVSFKIWPADRRDEASEIFPTSLVESLARAR